MPSKYNEVIAKWLVHRLIGEKREKQIEETSAALHRLIRLQRVPWPSPALDQLIEFLLTSYKLEERHKLGFMAVLSHPNVPADVLERLYAHFGPKMSVALTVTFAMHPNTSVELTKSILRHHNDKFKPHQLTEIALADPIRNDSEFRPMLLKAAIEANHQAVLLKFLIDANPDDCRVVFQKLPPEAAYVVLQHE